MSVQSKNASPEPLVTSPLMEEVSMQIDWRLSKLHDKVLVIVIVLINACSTSDQAIVPSETYSKVERHLALPSGLAQNSYS